MSRHDHAGYGHDHAHVHRGRSRAHAGREVSGSLLRASAASRLGGAAVMVALIWAAVLWAVA